MTSLASALDKEFVEYTDPTKFSNYFDSTEQGIIRDHEKREQPPIGDPNASCTTNLFFGFFFDGTGNSYADCLNKADKKEGFSNVARLYDAYPGRSVPGILPGNTDWTHERGQYKHFFRTYIPGVGTAVKQLSDPGGTAGLAFARYGQRRILWALLQVMNNVHRFFTGADAESGLLFSHERATALDSQVELGWTDLRRASYDPRRADSYAPTMSAQDALRALLTDLHKAVKPHMYVGKLVPEKTDPGIVKSIFVSIFGFSRGAAEARAFANWLLLLCELDAEQCGLLSGQTLAGFPVEFDFLGLFDTVASVGLPSSTVLADGHAGWADASHCLRISGAIKRCVHMVSAHEVRRSFPLDSVQIDASGNVSEIIYPGVHSDLGGGYLPTEQGRGKDPKGADMLSRIPLADMYRAARLAGAPLKPELMKGDIQDRFLVDSLMIQAFNSYLAGSSVKEGEYKQILSDQYLPYLAWRLSCIDEQSHGAVQQRFPGAAAEDVNDMVAGQGLLAEEVKTYQKWLDWNSVKNKPKTTARYTVPSFDPDHERHWKELEFFLEGVLTAPSPATAAKRSDKYKTSANVLFERYVHDSFAWFRPTGKDVGELRTMLEQLVATQSSVDGRKKLSDTENQWADLYRERKQIPAMKVDGHEPFWCGAGYLRYRKVYDGGNNRQLTQNKQSQPDVVLTA